MKAGWLRIIKCLTAAGLSAVLLNLIGKGSVISGWDEALKGVREGTKLQIKIPAKLAYGQQGVSSMGIPPNADLIFKVEVLKVT